ncbi:MAG: hypothetical protein QM729_06910 [Solirubrobacterales bacterium]
MSVDPPTPDAQQWMAIRRRIADLEAMPGVSEVLGRQVIDRDEFLGDGEPPAPEGICVEIRFRRRGEDPRRWHRLQVGPIAPGGAGDERGRRPRPGALLLASAMPSECHGCPRIPRDLTSGGEQSYHLDKD